MIEKRNRIFRIGPIRPPSEAKSLLLQVTEGCTWNKCKFCQLYRHCNFKAFSVDSIKEDIDIIYDYAKMIDRHKGSDGSWNHHGIMDDMRSMTQEEQNCYYLVYNWLVHGGQNVFLQDGNTLALKVEKVVEVLLYLRSKFPNIKRVTTYGRAETLSKISLEQYKDLKSVGLDRIHSGFESGSDKVLDLINKGVTSEQEILAGKNIKEAGIELSVYFMPGIGGKALSRDNALETARVIREINPDYVRIRTSVVKSGTELWEDYNKSSFELCSDDDKIKEIRLLIENCHGCTGVLASDHIINLMQNINGRLDKDRDKMLQAIDEYVELPDVERKMFQLARRAGMVAKINDLNNLSDSQLNQLKKISLSVSDESEWNAKINGMMEGYI